MKNQIKGGSEAEWEHLHVQEKTRRDVLNTCWVRGGSRLPAKTLSTGDTASKCRKYDYFSIRIIASRGKTVEEKCLLDMFLRECPVHDMDEDFLEI